MVVRVVSGSDPAGQLEALCELRRELDAIESELAAEAIRAGMSWREIGAAIGVSKQAAHRRHRDSVARLVKDADASPESDGNANGSVAVSVSARRAVRIARQEAASLGSNEVGTEHLLLGVLQCGDEPAAALLRRIGVTLEGARDAVQPTTEMTLEAARRAYANSERAGAATLVSPVARRILERALTHAAARDSSELTALDLLRSLVMHDESGAARTLTRMGIDPSRLRTEVSASQELKALPRV
ncbi:MAG TPA: Clp protease N-terminal domain-containing protein [Solirubrobacteraceae bacterium]|nr:Clp protease N-terminal domain-containing protein [Solirubrobacteraceae bacterium]